MEEYTATVTDVAKVLHADPQHLREAIDNGSFVYGFSYKTKRGKKVYKVSLKPVLEKLGMEYEEWKSLVQK